MSEILLPLTPATEVLDCLAMAMYGLDQKLVGVSEIKNNVGDSIGEVKLSKNYTASVRQAIGRMVPSLLARASELSHMPNDKVRQAPIIGAIAGNESYYEGVVSRVDMLFAGELVAGQQIALSRFDTELDFLGGNASNIVIDLQIQLRLVHGPSRIEFSPPVTLKGRIYKETTGASFFKLLGSQGYSQGTLTLERAAPVNHAIDYLFDLATASLIKDYLAAEGRSTAHCQLPLESTSTGHMAHQNAFQRDNHYQIDLFVDRRGIKNDRLCARVAGPRVRTPSPVRLKWIFYRATSIALDETYTSESSVADLLDQQGVCLQARQIPPFTNRVEVYLEHVSSGDVLGSAQYMADDR